MILRLVTFVYGGASIKSIQAYNSTVFVTFYFYFKYLYSVLSNTTTEIKMSL